MSFVDVIRRYRMLFILLLLAAVLALAGFWYISKGGADKVQRNTVKVSRGDIENLVTATGSLQPRDYVDVGAQVSGQLKTLHVEVGSEVKKGDLLAEIDATVYLAKVDATRAQLRNQQALLKDRQSQLKLAEINYRRQQNLRSEEAATQESLDSAEASLQSARAQIASLEAQIDQTESGLREEEANLEFANIYAPMDGTVVSLSARQGQTLNANQAAPTILQLADLSVMTVQAQVSEADVSKLSKAMDVYFTTLGGGGRRWYGKLAKIEPTPTVTNNVVLYNALFDVPNTNGLLMTQMTAQVFFVVSQAKDVLQVPVAALTYSMDDKQTAQAMDKRNENIHSQVADESGGPSGREQRQRPDGERPSRRQPGTAMQKRKATVQLLTAKGAVEKREVVVGVSNRVQAEVISGLALDDEVIVGVNTVAKSSAANRMQNMPPRMMR